MIFLRAICIFFESHMHKKSTNGSCSCSEVNTIFHRNQALVYRITFEDILF